MTNLHTFSDWELVTMLLVADRYGWDHLASEIKAEQYKRKGQTA